MYESLMKKTKGENYDLAKYVFWQESNRKPSKYFKSKEQHNRSSKEQLKKHLFRNLYNTALLYAEKVDIWSKIWISDLTFIALSSYCGACIVNTVHLILHKVQVPLLLPFCLWII